MCFGVPALILEVQEGALPMAVVEMAGALRECCLAYVPEAQVGDYVLIQNIFATSVLSDEDAHDTLALLGEMNLESVRDLPPLSS